MNRAIFSVAPTFHLVEDGAKLGNAPQRRGARGDQILFFLKNFFARTLHYNSRNCSQAAMKFSCCQADEFVRICLPGRQERCDNSVALFGYLPAIGVGNFGDQSMSVQQSQSPRDLGSLRALLLFVVGLPKEQGTDVTVAKALQSPD